MSVSEWMRVSENDSKHEFEWVNRSERTEKKTETEERAIDLMPEGRNEKKKKKKIHEIVQSEEEKKNTEMKKQRRRKSK